MSMPLIISLNFHVSSVISKYEIQLDLDVCEGQVTLPESSNKNKYFHTNHSCALCDMYKNYTHHCPYLYYFLNALTVLHKMDATHSDPSPSLPMDLGTNSSPGKEPTQPTIVIRPPNMEMTKNSIPILYLSSSIGTT